MIWLPGGTFRMGSDKRYREEGPTHRVTVDAFWIDRNPVRPHDRVRGHGRERIRPSRTLHKQRGHDLRITCRLTRSGRRFERVGGLRSATSVARETRLSV
jgi:hypothetical protein